MVGSALFALFGLGNAFRTGHDLWFDFAAAGALWLWHFHMQSSGIPRIIRLTALVTVAAQIWLQTPVLNNLGEIGSGLFVYLVIWVFVEYHRDPGLQALASTALLISVGVIAKPAVAIACAVLSGAFFAIYGRRLAGGNRLGFGLLLFTPAFLCLLTILVLQFVNSSALMAGTLTDSAQAMLHTDLGVTLKRFLGESGAASGVFGLQALMFPLAVITWRLAKHEVGGPDLAYATMVIVTVTIGFADWMPAALTSVDVFFICIGGAASLLANTGRRTDSRRAIASASNADRYERS
jgi:hypothetical protein